MAKQQVNTRLPEATLRQIERLMAKTGMTQTQVLIIAIDRMAAQELKGATMKTNVFYQSTNDLVVDAKHLDPDAEVWRHDHHGGLWVGSEAELQNEEDADDWTLIGTVAEMVNA